MTPEIVRCAMLAVTQSNIVRRQTLEEIFYIYSSGYNHYQQQTKTIVGKVGLPLQKNCVANTTQQNMYNRKNL
jgi:hypothetical protein